MDNDFMKRGYLLPDGCKDLIDVLRLKQKPGQCWLPKLQVIPDVLVEKGSLKVMANLAPLPPIRGEIVVPAQTTVAQLAALVHKKPFAVIADLMQLGVFATVSQVLEFHTIAKLARRYGLIAKPAT